MRDWSFLGDLCGAFRNGLTYNYEKIDKFTHSVLINDKSKQIRHLKYYGIYKVRNPGYAVVFFFFFLFSRH